MSRDITRPSDRLPAIKSVMKRIERTRGWSPICGLWKEALVEGLSWKSQPDSSFSGKHSSRMNEGYNAPSWSWASVDGRISYASVRALRTLTRGNGDPMIDDMHVIWLDPEKEVITTDARVGTVTLTCRIFNFSGKRNPSEEDLRYEYGLLGTHGGEEVFPFDPDVALKPFTENFSNGTSMTTPVRVPHGETPPTKSWTAKCPLLLIAKQKLRCQVLVLGASQREDGCWERVGMVSGLEPAVFAKAARQIWRLA